MFASSATIDFIDELMYRCWARRNYLPLELRERDWHPIILEEMADRDRELAEEMLQEERLIQSRQGNFVPLLPTLTHLIHPAQVETREPHFVSMRPALGLSSDSTYVGGIYEFQF